MWSYRRDLGRVRLLVIDSRCGRILADGQRSMVGERRVRVDRGPGRGRRLRPPGRGDVAAVAPAARPARPRIVGRGAERRLARSAVWRASANGCGGPSISSIGPRSAPRSIGSPGCSPGSGAASTAAGRRRRSACISGDVHHTLRLRGRLPESVASRVYQITCSPMHNTIPRAMRVVFRLGWSKKAARVMHALGRFAGVDPLPIEWHHPTGPHFGNELALLVFDGRSARVVLERSLPPPRAPRRGRFARPARPGDRRRSVPHRHAPGLRRTSWDTAWRKSARSRSAGC